MKRRLLLLLIILATAARADAQMPGAPLQRFSPAELAEDFRIARSALEEGHSGIYRYTPKQELDHEFDDAARKLDHPMDAYEFYRVLAPAVVEVRCGHTSVSLPRPLQDALNTTFPVLPFYVRVIDGKPYVLRDMSATGGKLAGLELLSINGVRASKMVHALEDATSVDGRIDTAREYRISGWRFATGIVRVLGITGPYHVSLWDNETHKEYRARLDGEPLPRLVAMQAAAFPQDSEPDHNADLDFLDNGAIARLTIRGFYGFADTARTLTIGEFIHASFDAIRVRGSSTLVIDLRNNTGGEDEFGRILLSYLVDRPFTYYDDLVINKRVFDFDRYADEEIDIPAAGVELRSDGRFHAVGHPNWGTQQPGTPGFAGKVIILINGGSFSTTSEFLSHVADRHRATFVGEESGGAYFGNTSGFMPVIVLPNTKLQLRIPLMTYYLAVRGPHDATRGIVPDVKVEPEIDDLIAGRDRAMEKALALARGDARTPGHPH